MYIIVGLGNPGEKYLQTRHNTGRLALAYLEKKELKGVKLVHLDTFMNKSGAAVSKFVKTPKSAGRMVVVYDDLDLPLGTMKISYDRGSGGHKGVESIMRAVKTKKFTRVRIGVSHSTASGAIRKPVGDKVILNYILTKFKAHELEELKNVFKRVRQALQTIAIDGRERAMNEFN